MRKQVKFIFQIGYAEQNEHFEANIIAAASRVSGGCTTSTKTGWWCEDGDEKKQSFSGRLAQEHCFELELTCELHKADMAYDVMCQEIASAAQFFEIETNWVHCSEIEMKGRHFSVAAINAAQATVAA